MQISPPCSSIALESDEEDVFEDPLATYELAQRAVHGNVGASTSYAAHGIVDGDEETKEEDVGDRDKGEDEEDELAWPMLRELTTKNEMRIKFIMH